VRRTQKWDSAILDIAFMAEELERGTLATRSDSDLLASGFVVLDLFGSKKGGRGLVFSTEIAKWD
jgi:hypothetical protein